MDPTPEAIDLLRKIVLADEFQTLRIAYCRATVTALTSISSWIRVDAFLGGGHQPLNEPPAPLPSEIQPDEYVAFQAIAAVIDMGGQLAAGAVALLDLELPFAASALVRQLIETEYLLTAFALDPTAPVTWARATADEIRTSFSPARMRRIGSFSNEEYWNHCDMGGHPTPHGHALLRFRLPRDGGLMLAFTWSDLAQHLRRVWSAVHDLLAARHPRFALVRADEIESVRSAEHPWVDDDPIANSIHFGYLDAMAQVIAEKDHDF